MVKMELIPTGLFVLSVLDAKCTTTKQVIVIYVHAVQQLC